MYCGVLPINKAEAELLVFQIVAYKFLPLFRIFAMPLEFLWNVLRERPVLHVQYRLESLYLFEYGGLAWLFLVWWLL